MIRTDNAVLKAALPQDAASRLYMASPFTVYPSKETAWRDACRAAAALQACTAMAVYSPIADSYGVEAVGGARLTHAEWMLRDRAMLLACQHVAVVMLPGWERSRGIAQETAWAHEARIPVWYLQPVGVHASGASAIGSMDAPAPEGYPALPLYHADLMREVWWTDLPADPYAHETVLAGLTELHVAGPALAIEGPVVLVPGKAEERPSGWLSGEDMIGAFYAK